MLYPNPRNPGALRVAGGGHFDRRHVPRRSQRLQHGRVGLLHRGWAHSGARQSPPASSGCGWCRACSTTTGAMRIRSPSRATRRFATQGRVIRAPNRKLVIDPAVLADYVGRFQIEDGPKAEFRVSDGKLLFKVNDDESELLPVTDVHVLRRAQQLHAGVPAGRFRQVQRAVGLERHGVHRQARGVSLVACSRIPVCADR